MPTTDGGEVAIANTTDGTRPRRAASRAAPRSEETRQRILDAAQALFAERGFDATATKAIAQRAGVPNGLIFYYFSSKERLLMDLLEERNVAPELRAAVGAWAHADPLVALNDIGLRFLAALRRREELAAILFREFRGHPEIGARFRNLREENFALVRDYLDEAIREGRLRPVNTHALARLFLSALLFEAFLERPPDPERVVAEAVDILLRGHLPRQ
jgi:AcrR family transcriptional regulator